MGELFVRRALSFGRERLPLPSLSPHRGRHTSAPAGPFSTCRCLHTRRTHSPKLRLPRASGAAVFVAERNALRRTWDEVRAGRATMEPRVLVVFVLLCSASTQAVSHSLSLTAPQGARCVVLRAASTQAHAHTDRGRATPMAEWSAMATFSRAPVRMGLEKFGSPQFTPFSLRIRECVWDSEKF